MYFYLSVISFVELFMSKLLKVSYINLSAGPQGRAKEIKDWGGKSKRESIMKLAGSYSLQPASSGKHKHCEEGLIHE